jgi:hypothetical protein
MAKIIENEAGRRMIRLNAEDVMSVIQGYQDRFRHHDGQIRFEDLKTACLSSPLYLPEDV